MDNDFNAGRNRLRNFDPSNPQPAVPNSRYDDTDVLAIAANDPFWQNANSLHPLQPQNPDSPDDGSDPVDPSNNQGNQGQEPEDGGDKPRWYKRLATKVKSLSRKQKIIAAVVILLLVASSAAAAATLLKDDAKPVQTVRKAEPAPTPPAPPTSPLTGLDTTAEDAKRPVLGVMIENSTSARPQSGLQEAGVVYEAIAEYGITRFLALFQEANPSNVGPVRSARPYYVDWARSYDAAYGHVGGSPDALAKIKAEGIRDMDQFANAGTYRRISQREAPHNVYTTGDNLRQLAAGKGWNSSTFTGLSRKKEAKAAAPTATAIDIAISGPTYNVHYDYDAASNSYLRTMAGAAHNDADSGKRIAPKVVIGLATQYGLMADGYHSTYATTGTGAAKIFQDGSVIEATWKREGTGNYSFTDAAGKEIKLNPGQTWITAVGAPTAITHSGPPAPAPATP